MNILILCYEFPPLGGGGAKVVHDLSTELTRRGHSIDIVTMGCHGLKKEETVNGVRLHRIMVARKNIAVCSPFEMIPYVLCAIPCALKLMKTKKYDIINTHFIYPDGIISFMLTLLTRVPVVVTTHGSDVPGYNPDRFKVLHMILYPLWQIIVRSVDLIVCPSNGLRTLVVSHHKKARTEVINNGIYIDKYSPQVKKEKSILVVTRMFERKGVQFLIRALSSLPIDHAVNIVGDGPYLEDLKALAQKHGVAVTFWGHLDNKGPTLKELYETSSIFVFTSSMENFPIVLLEAMSAEMAIITTRGTGCAEVVGDAALLVQPLSSDEIRRALVKLIEDDALRTALGKKARERLEKMFSWDIVCEKYLRVYHSAKKHGKS
ncbi:MAG: glycosyltransferase family 4 protein [Candidatus Omnitrophica bacterium]|nr:glycosyltransferase family 4 protein [Candidatus Omnitrophota bacterium]